MARIILAIHLKQICLGKQYGPKDDGDQVVVWAGVELHLVMCKVALPNVN